MIENRVCLGALLQISDGTEKPPTEFRIFRAGINETSKGPILFDDQAARDVMANFAKEGVDLMIDLDHQSMLADDRSRADAADARGWFSLALRNGELWAVNVSWTVDGARRLSEKTQRFISPVVFFEPKSNRAESILNLALVAAPATFDAQPLVAASRRVPSSNNVAVRLRAAKLIAKHKRQSRK